MAESISSDYKVIWDVRGQAPFRVANTVAYSFGACVGDRAYFLPVRASGVVYEYLSTTGKWRELPPCGAKGCALASIRGNLTTVGGRLRGGGLSDCLCWDETSSSWKSRYPPVPTSSLWPVRRSSDLIVVVTTVDHVVVMKELDVHVHVMDINTSQWTSVASLPAQALGKAVSVAICNGTVYIACMSATFPILHCSLDALLRSTVQQTEVWQVTYYPGARIIYHILVAINNKLLSIEVGNVFLYEEEKKTFLSVGSNPASPVFNWVGSMACVLPGGKILLCAGAGVLWAGKLSSPAEEEEKHLEAFRAVMAEKSSLEQTIMHCILFGYPGAGKSSLLKRLRGHPPDPTLPSTGVAERAVQVEIRRLTTTTAMALHTRSQQGAVSKWCTLSYDEEAIALMATATRNVSAKMARLSVSHNSSPATLTPLKETDEGSNEPFPSTQDSSMDLEPAALSDKETKALSTHAHIPPIEILKQAIKRTGLKDVERYLQQSMTLYITDTGGQLEFQELLPALTAGPTLFFLVFRLDQDLDKTVSIEFRYPDGHSTKPYHSSFTVREALLQSLASIASMGSYVYNRKRGKPVVLKPRVIFIGTHRDQVSSTKEIQIDRRLLKIVKSTSLYREGLIERVSESQLMITVNNLSRDDNHFQHIRSIVERIADRDSFRVSLPSTWLVFSLVIRQLKKCVITYTECFNIAQQCGINSQDELNEALWFLNTKVGLVRHFRGEGLEDLQDIVIVDPQILFIKITQLIVNTFTDDRVTANVCDEFKSKGIFPHSVLERLSSIDEDSELLTVNRFVKLLEHLHIISRLHTEEVMYFMPCILAHAQSTASESSYSSSAAPSTDTRKIPPLLVTFRCGYCPKGLFSALVVYLLANKMKSQLIWELQTEHIFRNSISLCVGPHDITTLTLTPTYLEVAMLPAEGEGERRLSVEVVCTEVRQSVEKAVREVTSSLHYTNDAEHALAFYCTGRHEAGQERHPANIVFYMNDPSSIQCEVGGKKQKRWLPDVYLHWYSKDECSPPLPTTQEHAQGLPQPQMLAGQSGPPSHLYMPTSQLSVHQPQMLTGQGGLPSHMPPVYSGLPQPPMLAGQSGPPSNMLTGYHHYQPQPLSGPPHYIGNTNQFGISGTVGQPPIHPPLRSYQAGPPSPPRPQNVNPDLRQHPVRILAGEPRPVQEPTGLQGWPHPLHSAVQVFGNQHSLELTVFQEKRSIIHRGILHNVQDIASRAFAQHLIPDRVCEDVTGLSQLTANQRTDMLLSELQSRIIVDGKALTTFLHVLSEADACYEPLIRSIIDAMRRPAEQGGQH